MGSAICTKQLFHLLESLIFLRKKTLQEIIHRLIRVCSGHNCRAFPSSWTGNDVSSGGRVSNTSVPGNPNRIDWDDIFSF